MRVVAFVVALLLFLAMAPLWASTLGIGPPPAPAPGLRVEIGSEKHLNVFDEGTGTPVILVHGRPGSAYDWQPLPAQLVAAGFRVIRYDRIGYGHSSLRSDDDLYDYATNADELFSLIDALDLPSVLLVGWSFGGGIAQIAARERPSRVEALVLVASVAPGTDRSDFAWAERLLEWSEPLQQWGIDSGFTSRPGLDRVGRLFFSGPAPAGWVEHMQATLALPGAVHSWIEEGRHPRFDQLRPEAITVPTTILMGTDDATGDFEIARDLHRRIEGARLVRVEGGSHMLPNTHAELVVEELERLR